MGRSINEGIEDRELKEYFMTLLGGMEKRVVRGVEGRRRGWGGENKQKGDKKRDKRVKRIESTRKRWDNK